MHKGLTMEVRNEGATELAELRTRAEERMRARDARVPELSETDVKKLVFELGTHQIELEMQNEELRRSQLLIAESRDVYTELFDFAPIGYVTIDHSGRIRQANLTLANLLQLDRKAIIGQLLMTFVHSDDTDELFLAVRKQQANGPPVSIEVRFTRPGGDRFHARIDIGAPRSLGSDEALRLVAIADITEIKQAEAKRNELQQRIHQSQRLESLGVLAGGIAHDFNNLLTIISLNNDVVGRSLEHESPLQTNIDQIKFAVKQSTALCEQMLAHAGKSQFEKRLFDVTRMLQDAGKFLASAVAKNVSLELKLPENSPMVLGDPAQIRQVVLNLVMNASESIADQGHVSVALGVLNDQDPTLVDMSMSEQLVPGEYICIDVRDSGGGIDPQDTQRIFEPFFTRKFAGRGLGLSVASGIIHRHNGVIAIHSVMGHGTRIGVLLPIANPETLSPFADSEIQDEGEFRMTHDVREMGSILIVDDEPTVRHATQAALEFAKFSVVSADCGEQAIEVFQAKADAISLILLDYTMPGISCDETISGLQRIRDDVPIVLMSGHSERNISSFMAQNNVAAFLPKPFENLVGLIQGVLESKQGFDAE